MIVTNTGCQGRLDLLGGWDPLSDEPRAAGATPGLSTASPTGAHTVVGDLAGLFGNIPIGIFPTKPKQNYCVYFGPRSVIATELDFSSFFDQPHTIAGWFMPQYTVGSCHGPLFAASGPERYFVGQGDYRSGNTLTTKMNLAPGVATKAGDPVLAVYAGSESRIFLAPTFKSGVWQHVAVVRQPALSTGDVLSLYLNGKKLRLDDQPRAVGSERPQHMTRGPDRVAHVVAHE